MFCPFGVFRMYFLFPFFGLCKMKFSILLSHCIPSWITSWRSHHNVYLFEFTPHCDTTWNIWPIYLLCSESYFDRNFHFFTFCVFSLYDSWLFLLSASQFFLLKYIFIYYRYLSVFFKSIYLYKYACLFILLI